VIALLRGEVVVRRPDHVIVLCGGVGYRAAVSAQTLAHVPAVGREVTLHTQLFARDDGLALYGFHCEEERDLFCQLLGVPAVGPKLALAILSRGPTRELVAAIAAGDSKRFLAAPGVGRRTAERLVAELRERVGGLQLAGTDGGAVAGAVGPRALARDGLVELGFSYNEAEQLLDGSEGGSAEELLAAALRKARGGVG